MEHITTLNYSIQMHLPASAMGWSNCTMLQFQVEQLLSVDITEGGSGYTNGEELFFDTSSVATGGIAGSPGAKINIVTAGISSATGNYVQVTGLSTGTDAYYRINSVPATNININSKKLQVIQY